jgi:hypothetical protein
MRMMPRFVSVGLLLPCALTMLLGARPAIAQDVKGEKELTERGQRIDKVASTADSRHVTDRIVDEWKGTTFKFGASDSHQLTAADVQSLRQKGLGFGEISILLALAAKQTSTNPKSVNDILAMRSAGEGWGKIAKDLGYKNLGSVLKSVKGAEKDVDRVAKADDKHAEKIGKTEKVDKMDKPGRIERIDRPERPERAERPGR